jgi:spoIIIJ-associated protein
MNTAEGAGRTIDEAVAAALIKMGAARDEVEVEIIQEPRPALLGLGGREARVRITKRRIASDECRDFTTAVLERMGYDVDVEARDTGEGIVIGLEGEAIAGLIGRYGRVLDALEFLVAAHQARRSGARVPLTVDAAGYRARRQKALIEIAESAAARAVVEGRAVPLEPMEPRDRRTIHLALAGSEEVTTASEGEYESRHVVIIPRPERVAQQGQSNGPPQEGSSEMPGRG